MKYESGDVKEFLEENADMTFSEPVYNEESTLGILWEPVKENSALLHLFIYMEVRTCQRLRTRCLGFPENYRIFQGLY